MAAKAKQPKKKRTVKTDTKPNLKKDIKVETATRNAPVKTQSAPKKTVGKKAKTGIWFRFTNYIRGVRTELKKVTWLNREELQQASGVVFGIVGISAFTVWVMDTGLSFVAKILLDLSIG
ncbi:MAG: preprotein translocase subunit SecE [Eubacteriaceae bacterium]|jgi:preprotein translocase subunit SecE|nr:preprotein translocase subunit SecE [Eubacteriaceae bacterium]